MRPTLVRARTSCAAFIVATTCAILLSAAGTAAEPATPGDLVETQSSSDGFAEYTHLGVTIASTPRLHQTNPQEILGFEITVTYEEIGTAHQEIWIDRTFISALHKPKREHGPFKSVRGANFKVAFQVRQNGLGTEPTLETQLLCDNLELEQRYYETFGRPQLELVYGKIEYPVISFVKDAYQLFSTVSFVYDIGNLVKNYSSAAREAARQTGRRAGAQALRGAALASRGFVVGIVIDTVLTVVLSQIPDHYEGAIAYRCKFCGETLPLAEIRGCRTIECCDGVIRVRVCRTH